MTKICRYQVCGGKSEIILSEIPMDSYHRRLQFRGRLKNGNCRSAKCLSKVDILAYTREKFVKQQKALSQIKHPLVAMSLACGQGINPQQNENFFIAYESFYSLDIYLEFHPPIESHRFRFTPEFLGILRDLVKGVMALHERNLHIGNLINTQQIFVVEVDEPNGTRYHARLASFERIPSGEDVEKIKKKDWRAIGTLIQAVAIKFVNMFQCREIKDLAHKIMKNELKGLDIFKHPAMWTVQQKDDFIFALNRELHMANTTLNLQPEEIFGMQKWYGELDFDLSNLLQGQHYSGIEVKAFTRLYHDINEHRDQFVQFFDKKDLDPDAYFRHLWPSLFINLRKLAPNVKL